MRSPLKPLLCRHEFYWSERRRCDLCRGCGKTRVAAEPVATVPSTEPTAAAAGPEGAFFLSDGPQSPGALDSAFFDIPLAAATASAGSVPVRRAPSAKALKAQAIERRENLLALLDRLAEGGLPSRQDSLDVVLAVIEDAHSAEPVLFGPAAVDHFARLHAARGGLIF